MTVEGFEYHGVKVVAVKGPAQRAGVVANDIITHLNLRPAPFRGRGGWGVGESGPP